MLNGGTFASRLAWAQCSIIHFTQWKILRFPTLTFRQAALKTNEKPLQMTGSPHTNIQRRPQYRVLRRLFPLAWMWNSQEALRNTWWMEGGRWREGGEGKLLSPEPHRPAHSTPLDTFRSLKARAQSRAKQPSEDQTQNGPGRARKSRLDLDGGLAWLQKRNGAGTGYRLPKGLRPLLLWPVKFKRRPVKVLGNVSGCFCLQSAPFLLPKQLNNISCMIKVLLT